MAEKFITSRVKQRFDTLSEWQAVWETFKPLKGEVCKIQIPANTEVTGLRTSSSVRVMTKTGDGETTLALLPWDSAIGADETQLSKGTDKTASNSLSHGGTFTAITETSVSGHKVTDTITTYTLPAETVLSVTDGDSGNAVTNVTVSGHAITLHRGKNFLTDHPTISTGTDSTSSATLAHSGTFTAVDSVTRDSNGHVTKINTKTYTLPADSDTKNTAGGGDTSSKIYLVGVTSQATGTSYTHDTAYVETDGHLYSNSAKVLSTTYAPEGFLQWGGNALQSQVTPIGMALSAEHSGNKTAFINGDAISIEYSTDGTNFTDAGIAKKDKSLLFTTSCAIPIGGNTSMTSSNYNKLKTRITLTAQDGTNGYIYTDVKKLLVNMSTAVTVNMQIETLDGNSSTWQTFGTYSVAGWSGWNDIPLMITLGGSSTQKERPWKVRFTFSLTSYNTSYSTTKHVYGFRIFGQNSWNVPSTLGQTGHLYSYDADQNATFPAALNTVGNLTENGVRVSKIGHTHSVTAAGTVSKPTFTGTAASHNHTFTGTEAGHTHTFTGTAASHNHTFTGTAHDHSFTGSAVTSGGASATISINSVTSVGTAASHPYTAPSLTASCSNQCLTITWSAGSHSFTPNTVPTVEAKTVATAHTHSVTAAGTVGSKTAGGTIADTSVTPAGTIGETKITPAGTVGNTSITPAGTISQPTFTGSDVTSGDSSN